jgi:hypothetical protein
MTTLFVQYMGGGGLILFLLISIAYFILWIYYLVGVIRSNLKDSNMKLIWVVVLLFADVLGPIAYLVLGKGTKTS